MKKVAYLMFAVVLLCSIVYAECAETDYRCQVKELQEENKRLKEFQAQSVCNQNDLDCRLTVLEQKFEIQEEDIFNIYDSLDFIFAWLDYIICEHLNLCEEQVVCSEASECPQPAVLEELYCQDGNVWTKAYEATCSNAGTVDSFCGVAEIDTQTEVCEYGCEEGSCHAPPNDKVTFRTNVENGDYYNTIRDAWIAFDRDSDGDLEPYGIRARSSWNNGRCNIDNTCDGQTIPCVLTRTPTNDKLVDYGNSNTLVICDELNHRQIFYKKGDSDSDDAELSSDPTEPFTSNNQEVIGSLVWSTITPLPLPQASLFVESVGDRLFAGHGAGGGSQGDFYEYNFGTNTWSKKAQDSDVYERASTKYDNKIYAFGGVTHGGPLARSSVYDPATNTWQLLANMPTTRVDINNADEVNGKIYVMGGPTRFGSQPGSDGNERYDPVTNTWAIMANMPLKRMYHATAAVGNKIYVFGGQDSSFSPASSRTTFDQIDVYDTTSNTWQTLSVKMPKPLSALTAVSYGDKIYLFGGSEKPPEYASSNSVYEFDPSTNTFKEKTPMPTPRTGLAAAVHNGKIYVIGGQNEFVGHVNVAEVYNPSVDN